MLEVVAEALTSQDIIQVQLAQLVVAVELVQLMVHYLQVEMVVQIQVEAQVELLVLGEIVEMVVKPAHTLGEMLQVDRV